MPSLPAIRQIVLLVPDLEPALAEFRQAFGFTRGTRHEEGMAQLGFEHEIFTFGDTFLEICAPLSPDSHAGKLVERHGPIGYMVDVQVSDLASVIARAGELDITPVLARELDGHQISQWHPKAFGTLAEFDQIEPHDTWHFAPGIFEASCTDVAQDMVAAELAVPVPIATAKTWAAVLDAEVVDDTTVVLQKTQVRFVPAGDRTGLVAVDVTATDPARVGETIHLSGVDFRFVAASTED